jgi:hypothetical protein
MPLTSLATRLSVILAVSLLVACGVASAQTPRTLVEVWKGGDDGLTNKLADALKDAFKSSSDFQLSTGKKPGTLVATIPSNVEWKQVGKRTKVLYKVNFASVDNRPVGASEGSCWDDALAKCANKIVKDATAVAAKVHQD